MVPFADAEMVAIPGKFQAGRQVFVVVDDFYFDIGGPHSGLRRIIRRGTETDKVSFPAGVMDFLRRWLPPVYRWAIAIFERMAKSAAVHDDVRRDLSFSLIETDCIFLMAMHQEHSPRTAAYVAFALVRTNRSRD